MKTQNNTAVVEISQQRVSKHNLTLSRINIIKEHSSTLTVNGVKDHAGLKKVVRTRKFIKRLRINVEVKRRELNADMLREIRENNFAARFIVNELKPSEKNLGNIEKEIANEKLAIKLEKKRQKLERLQKRIDALAGFAVAVDIASIEDLSEEEFNALLVKTQFDYEVRKKQKEFETKQLADENKRLLEENIQLKQSVAASDPAPDVALVIQDQNTANPAPADNTQVAAEVKAAPSPEDIIDTKLLIKNYAVALKAVPVPDIKNEQARLILLSAQSHINTGINMLLKAVE